jgi:hypothetical protein
MAFASSSCSTLTRGWRGNRTRAIIPVGCAPFSAGGRYAGTAFSDQPHQLVHHRPFGETPRRLPARTIQVKSSQVKSSQVKSSQVHPFTTKESIQYQIREGQHLVHVHHSSRHTTRKQHLFTAEAFHLPARPVLREYSYRVLCSRHRCYATTISEYGISSRRPDPKHDRNPALSGRTKFGETAVHFCTDTHEDVGPTVVDRR